MSETVKPDGLAQKIAYDLCMHKELRITLGQMEFLEGALVEAVNAALRQPDTRMEGGGEPDGYVDAKTQCFFGPHIDNTAGLTPVWFSQTEPEFSGALAKNRSRLYTDIAAPSSPTVGELDVVAWGRLRELIAEYFDLGYAEGVVQRDADTMAGDAQRTLSEIEAIISSAQSSIQRAERERDALHVAYRAEHDGLHVRAASAIARADAAEAQLEEARKVFNDAFDFLGGVDAADEIREAILPFLSSLGEKQDAE